MSAKLSRLSPLSRSEKPKSSQGIKRLEVAVAGNGLCSYTVHFSLPAYVLRSNFLGRLL